MKAFFATTLAGYDIESVPRFETTSAAVYGRLTRAKRGLYRGVAGVRVTLKEKRSNKPSTSVLLQQPQREMQLSLSTWLLTRWVKMLR
jgi:hypothetical protein